jgi:hypothetical protein
MRQRALIIAGETDQSRAVFLQFLHRDGESGLFVGAKLCGSQKAAEILISQTGLHEQRDIPAIGNADFRADMRPDPYLFSAGMKTRGAIKAIPVEKRHGGHFVRGAGIGQCFRQRGAFQEGKCGAGVEFDVTHAAAKDSVEQARNEPLLANAIADNAV